jgi:OmpA-OmpF porin, OOP family
MAFATRFSQPRYFALAAFAVTALMAGGCTTKNYVRQQTTPLMDHVNQLDAETAKNTNAIRAEDQKTQQGIAAVDAKTQQALDQAQQTQSQAQQVSGQLNATSGKITALDATIANLDEYKQTSQATVHFALNKAELTPDAKQILDGVVAQVQGNPHGILEVQGYTDTTGPKAFNEKLSQERANSVVRYLEANNIAPHRIYLIGLGENQPAEPNTTLQGRQFNRRVDIKLLTDNLGKSGGDSGGQ